MSAAHDDLEHQINRAAALQPPGAPIGPLPPLLAGERTPSRQERRAEERAAAKDVKCTPDVQAYRDAELPLIPLGIMTKIPALTRWQSAQHTHAEIDGYIARGHNIGFRIPDGWLVIDYDPRNDPDGAGRTALITSLPPGFLDTCPHVRTPTGGDHWYVRVTPGTKLRMHVPNMAGTDLKSLGGQVLIPGDIHPLTKTKYEWDDFSPPLSAAPMLPSDCGLLVAARRPEPTSSSGTPGELSPEQLAKLLAKIDPSEHCHDYKSWIDSGMAAHHATGGLGVEEWVEWSARDEEFSGHGAVAREKWASFSTDRADSLTILHLFDLVAKAGGTLSGIYDFPDDLPAETSAPRPSFADALPRPGHYDRDRGGNVRPTVRNAIVAVEHELKLRPALNDLSHRVEFRGDGLPWDEKLHGRTASDDVVRIVGVLLSGGALGTSFGAEALHEATRTLALRDRFNPVEEYLDSLAWDRVSRFGRWLAEYCGADDTEYTRAVSRHILLGAVDRARNPGSKLDEMATLEGPQGCGKSLTIKVLGGEYAREGLNVLNLRSAKEVVEALDGAWLVEVSELAAIKRADDVAAVKDVLSRQVDHARAAYAKSAEDYPRRSVFIGTTNESAYLLDSTGNRRFLPVKVGAVDLKRLTQDRDQLWAEAAAAHKRGERPAFPERLYAEAARQTELRVAADPWAERIGEYLEREEVRGRSLVTSRELLDFAAGKAGDRQTKADWARVRGIMERAGWTYAASGVWDPNQSKTVKGYLRPGTSLAQAHHAE